MPQKCSPHSRACCRVRSADARLINSRKILVRADVVCVLTGFEQTSQEIRTLKDAPSALQTKTAEYRCVLPREFGEKSVTMTEDLELSAGEAEMERIVQYWVIPEITEQKLTGNKAVFKGNLTFKALYLTMDGAPETFARGVGAGAFGAQWETIQPSRLNRLHTESIANFITSAAEP